ncbi:Uncharacterised protein [Mycobacterium tuberculosis]|nr:Uncharacterised protein [Mycobacterium tuberculosis]
MDPCPPSPSCCTASCSTGSKSSPSAPNATRPSPVNALSSLSATDFSGPDSKSPCLRARSRSSSTPSNWLTTLALARSAAAC